MIVNPYGVGQTMTVDTELWSMSYGLLRHLVWAASVKNLDQLKAAKQKLMDTGFPPERLAKFNSLPDNVATRDGIRETDKLLRDNKQRDIIVTEWISFFRDKYEDVAN